MIRAATTALLGLCLLATVRADEPAPTVTSALARALTQAEGSGALARVLGTHRFQLTRSLHTLEGAPRGQTVLDMVYEISLQAGLLVVAVDVRSPGDVSGVSIRYEVEAREGRLLRLESSFGNGQKVSARLEGRTLRVTEQPFGGEPVTREEQVDPAALCPKVVGAFILPMLHDQGLPPRLPFRDLDPFGRVGPPAVLRRAFTSAGEVVFCTDEGGGFPGTTLRVPLRGPHAGRVEVFETVSEQQKTPSGEDRVVHLARSVRKPD